MQSTNIFYYLPAGHCRSSPLNEKAIVVTLPDKKPWTQKVIQGLINQWSRWDLNPRPDKEYLRFLHAYHLLDCRDNAGEMQTNTIRIHFILLQHHDPAIASSSFRCPNPHPDERGKERGNLFRLPGNLN